MNLKIIVTIFKNYPTKLIEKSKINLVSYIIIDELFHRNKFKNLILKEREFKKDLKDKINSLSNSIK